MSGKGVAQQPARGAIREFGREFVEERGKFDKFGRNNAGLLGADAVDPGQRIRVGGPDREAGRQPVMPSAFPGLQWAQGRCPRRAFGKPLHGRGACRRSSPLLLD
ncbi:hypothetical protein [Streptomyces sp. NPDC085540]|uniref:hypothetical protein n=1 Tax=Streptomyces sp. NPDC085540 TaxID=3365730 RepID=UPI0037CFD092